MSNYLLLRNAQGQLGSTLLQPKRSISGVFIDTFIDYSHTSSVRITENPTETGVNINDHRIINPRRIVMNVGVSNVVTPQALLNSRSADALIQVGKAFIFGNSFDSKSRIAVTYSALEEAMYDGEPFDIETPMGLFKNMLITQIEETNDADTYTLFNGTITLQELLSIESEAFQKTTQKAGTLAKEKGGRKFLDAVPTGVLDLIPEASNGS